MRADIAELSRDVAAKLRVHDAERANDLPAWPSPLNLEALSKREPQPPKFVIPDYLPAGYATLFAGHGGVGKSGIALHLAVCMAAGLPFFGLSVWQRRVLYLSCEDREGVLHWRLSRICRHLCIDMARLYGWLEVLDLVGHQTVLWDRDPRTGRPLTPAYGLLSQRVEQHGTQVLVVDGVSDTYGGNENARAEVKAYVNMLLRLIPADDGALLLIGHIAKPAASGANTTEGYSGSTAWHNAARARWYLYPELEQSHAEDRPERTGDLVLELQKSNLGRSDRSMRFAWDGAAHLFVGREIVAATASDLAHRARTEREAVLKAIQGCMDGRIVIPAATTGQRTAYHILSLRPEFPQSLHGKAGKKRFWRAIEELRQMRCVEEQSHRKANRHSIPVLVPTGAGCANAPIAIGLT